ncbi:uncharacterized protein LOC124396408 isoform X2 [Silurus meridionalis]|uniref:uncharacterized protein LOC124396408 isoform X2 n=1 Tax=Silurus meridionalis TaxID=175797 RepID=UPI001EEA116F|nr:uncharacterized protein LOC124396408 isoform X2 [Silurus meridionalis]
MKSRYALNVDPKCCNERVLNDCHQMYTDSDRGLITIAQSVGMTLLPPRKKITVMLIGGHSVGKSSFINWYVEEHIQKPGGAIGTHGFTFVTSGCKRTSLTGVSEYISTEICTSRQKQFSLVTFVDTPGLVDGDMKYPFDVDQTILQLGDVCDLILVFFDPIGQALCKRTLNIVEQLKVKHGDRVNFYLSKADEARGESDRQKAMMQIAQELGIHDFDMPTIYIPNPNKPSRCVNQIEEVCHTIQKTIDQTVQNTLNTLGKDCEVICEAVIDTLNNDRLCYKENSSVCNLSCALTLLGFSVMLLFILFISNIYWEFLVVLLSAYGIETLLLYLDPFMRALDSLPMQIQLIICGFLMQLSVILHILAYLLFNSKPTLSGKQKIELQEKLEYVQEMVKPKKKKLHVIYHQQSIGDQDTD